MTYQASSNKLLLSDIRQRLWAIIVMFLVFFITEPLSLLMTIENFELYNELSYLPKCICDYLSYGYAGDGRFAMVAGGIMAFICFGYLYSKSAVDLYHSLPVRRGKIYLYKIITGAGFGTVTLLVCSALSFILVASKGYLSGVVARALMLTSVKGIVGFLMTFASCTIAIMLTGTIIVGILGSAVLTFLPSIVGWITEGYMNLCFSTYYVYSDKITVGDVLLIPMRLLDLTTRNRNAFLLLLAVYMEALVVLFIGLILFVKRPSESMSKAICFNIAKPVIRIPLVILAALTGGLYVSYIASSLAAYWYWTAFLGLGLLAHAVLELVFEQEVKGIIRHPVQLVSCMVLAALISLSLQYDWFGYDTFIPDVNKVKSASVRLLNIEGDMNGFELNDFGTWEYSSRDDFFEKVSTDTDVALNLANISVSGMNKTGSAISRHMQELTNGYDVYSQCLYVVCYHMASGRDIYRSYQTDIEYVESDVAKVYEDSSYKDYIYDINPGLRENIRDSIQCFDVLQNEVLNAKVIDVDKLLDAYTMDLKDREFNDLKSYPIFTLSGFDMVCGMDFLSMCYIYETDTRTIDYIRSLGINTDDYIHPMNAESIMNIRITRYDANTSEYVESETEEYTAQEDADVIAALADKLIPSNIAYINSILHPVEPNVEMYVNYANNDGMMREAYCQVAMGTEL